MKAKSLSAGQMLRLTCVLMLMALVVLPVRAQEEKEKETIAVEVKDGKVYVNGEMVKELDNKNARIKFSHDGEEDFIILSDGDEGELRHLAFRRAPRNVELFKDLEADWAEQDFSNAWKEFNVAVDMEPMRENLMLMREGMAAPYILGSSGNREHMKMEHESQELAGKLRRAEGEDKATLNNELEELLNKMFDIKLEDQEKRVVKMNEELDKLRERLQERQSSREQIIERRMRQLRGERDSLDW